MTQKDPDLSSALNFFGLSSLQGVGEGDIKKIYHTLAKKYHPDAGGNSEEFIFLRKCYVLLKKTVSEPVFNQSGGSYSNQGQKQEYTEADFISQAKYFRDEMDKYKQAYNKLNQEIDKYETVLNSQIRLVNYTAIQINSLNQNYQLTVQQAKERLEVDREIAKKARNFSLKNIFLGRISQNECVIRQNRAVEAHNQKIMLADKYYTENLLKVYSSQAKELVDLLNKV